MDLENDVMGIDPEANKKSSPRETRQFPWFHDLETSMCLDVIYGVFDNACRRLSFEKSTWRSCLYNSRLVIVTSAVARSKDFTWKMSFSKSNQKTEQVPNILFSAAKLAKHKQSVKRKTQWNGWKQTWPKNTIPMHSAIELYTRGISIPHKSPSLPKFCALAKRKVHQILGLPSKRGKQIQSSSLHSPCQTHQQ